MTWLVNREAIDGVAGFAFVLVAHVIRERQDDEIIRVISVLHAMSENNTNKPDSADRELGRLAAMSGDDIDTSDIPEVRNWSRAERGKFYRPGTSDNVPLYLDLEVTVFLRARAAALGIPLRDLANEMLRKDIELVRSVEPK
ncbi:hypothetical protein SAHL_04355 [Salinisphaera orenii YIM 95161]|uniref:Uncharacterized protein n=2 Tax=Salinisphaera TaxID=180541 RepID=A0A423Q302_9GAMM|nr:hypothetical protein SAHL_04355 [Salinisphaera halophila YIM 95161]